MSPITVSTSIPFSTLRSTSGSRYCPSAFSPVVKGRRDDPVASHGNVCLVTEKGLVHRLVPDPASLSTENETESLTSSRVSSRRLTRSFTSGREDSPPWERTRCTKLVQAARVCSSVSPGETVERISLISPAGRSAGSWIEGDGDDLARQPWPSTSYNGKACGWHRGLSPSLLKQRERARLTVLLHQEIQQVHVF